ncbi:MAG: ribosome maturation factor RimM [Desulfobacterales bacterium]
MSERDMLAVGRITGVHGIRGSLKIIYYAEPTGIQKDGFTLIRHPSGWEKEFEVKGVRPYKKGALLFLEEVTDRSHAEKFVGGEIFVYRRDLPELEEGVYYWADLIGMQVYDGDRLIGRMEAIIETGSNDVYVVKDKNGKETLIPALASVVLDVNVKTETMRVRLPDGL